VDKALNYVFAKDRDFQDYLKSPLAAKAVPSLRVRRAGTADLREPVNSGRRPRSGVETRRQRLDQASLAPEESRSVLRTG
jgi:hypothetical protein